MSEAAAAQCEFCKRTEDDGAVFGFQWLFQSIHSDRPTDQVAHVLVEHCICDQCFRRHLEHLPEEIETWLRTVPLEWFLDQPEGSDQRKVLVELGFLGPDALPEKW